ncbi:MAG TPA: hypothetical protein VGE94_08645, partial [Chloroflexota bacterium]
MRTLATSLCSLVLLLAPAARPALADDLVVDDATASVQVKGTWATSTTTPGFVGTGYHYRVAGDGSSTVRWPWPSSSPAGSYEVFARWTSGPNRASNATYLIAHTAGAARVSVDQRSNGGAWQSLGTFAFSAAVDQGVTLSDKADGIVVADALRFVPSTGATAVPAVVASGGDARFFPQTQFRVERDTFWDFFSRRGGVRTFGFPISRELTLGGCQTQLFQRLALQQCGGQGVGTLNVLDDTLLSANRFGASTVPPPEPSLISGAPLPTDATYASKAIDFVRANAPDTFDGEPVNFFGTFQSTVSLVDAFPQGNGDAGLLPLLNLQLWGMPTSKPAYDPNNHEFIYLRFQRGVMHYDRGCRCTQALLVTDAFKDALKGSGRVAGDVFTVQTPAALPVAAPAAPAAPPATPVAVSSPDYGMSAFVWGHPDTTGRDLKLVTDVGFRWQKTLFQWRHIEGACKGCFDWSEADRVVKASAAAGVQVIARLDFQPAWSRRDGASNGPPDNYQDFADFVSAFVARYSAQSSVGRIAAIEVWNEVNLDREWGGATIDKKQAADYVRLLGLAYGAAKAADPSVTVITAGLSPTGVTNGHSADDVQYLQWLYDAGLKGNYDVLGAHGNVQAPEVEAAFGSLPNFPH